MIAGCTLGCLRLVERDDIHSPRLHSVSPQGYSFAFGGVAVTSPPATSLALKDYPDIAGTASSLLGLARYAFGGIAAPLVGIGGANDAVPFGIVAAASVAAAALCLGLVRRRRGQDRIR